MKPNKYTLIQTLGTTGFTADTNGILYVTVPASSGANVYIEISIDGEIFASYDYSGGTDNLCFTNSFIIAKGSIVAFSNILGSPVIKWLPMGN